ncbi:flagellar FliJ family protein [Legionella lytica]|uniref:Flagellar FliJ protein n=1 Tax=Legionella lytica TaxID=96232 RepID=A0ABY4Y637_9GAMM|nr:flagellar FliJ family protein [Legionella lytica]USQ13091.1 flagellar FliJ family protein [Legionella lytica]
MNKSLAALMTKLNWQLNELNLQLHEVQNQLEKVRQEMESLDKQIQQAGINSLTINPDFEINRLNFITQRHEKKEELNMALKQHQDTERSVQEKMQRIKTELKMLEKYLEREQTERQEQQKKAENNALDEWVIQRG